MEEFDSFIQILSKVFDVLKIFLVNILWYIVSIICTILTDLCIYLWIWNYFRRYIVEMLSMRRKLIYISINYEMTSKGFV